MTAEQLEELLGKVTQGEWRQGQEGNNRVYGPDCMGDDSGLIACVYKGRANCKLIALTPSLARRVIAAERLALEVGKITASNENIGLLEALIEYREASK